MDPPVWVALCTDPDVVFRTVGPWFRRGLWCRGKGSMCSDEIVNPLPEDALCWRVAVGLTVTEELKAWSTCVLCLWRDMGFTYKEWVSIVLKACLRLSLLYKLNGFELRFMFRPLYAGWECVTGLCMYERKRCMCVLLLLWRNMLDIRLQPKHRPPPLGVAKSHSVRSRFFSAMSCISMPWAARRLGSVSAGWISSSDSFMFIHGGCCYASAVCRVSVRLHCACMCWVFVFVISYRGQDTHVSTDASCLNWKCVKLTAN